MVSKDAFSDMCIHGVGGAKFYSGNRISLDCKICNPKVVTPALVKNLSIPSLLEKFEEDRMSDEGNPHG